MTQSNFRNFILDESAARSLVDAVHGLRIEIPLALIKIVGDLEAAAYLGFSAFLSSSVRSQDGWFFLEQEKDADPQSPSLFLRLGSYKAAIGLGKDGQQRARSRLSKLHLHMELPSERQQKEGLNIPSHAGEMVLLTQRRGAPPRLFYRVDLLNYVGLLGGDFSKAVNSAFERSVLPLSKDVDSNTQKRQNPPTIYREDIKTKIIENNDNSCSGDLDLSQIPKASQIAVSSAIEKCDKSDQQDIIDLTALALKEKRVTKNAERYASGLVKIALNGMLDRTPLNGYRAEIARRRETERVVSQVHSRSHTNDPDALAKGAKMLEKIRGKRQSKLGNQKLLSANL